MHTTHLHMMAVFQTTILAIHMVVLLVLPMVHLPLPLPMPMVLYIIVYRLYMLILCKEWAKRRSVVRDNIATLYPSYLPTLNDYAKKLVQVFKVEFCVDLC